MSRRGAGTAAELRPHEFGKAPEDVADRVVKFARSLLVKHHMEPAEAATLMVNAAVYLALMEGAFSRQEWLEVSGDLWDQVTFDSDENVTAPGGDA
jgi:hypothetical protein